MQLYLFLLYLHSTNMKITIDNSDFNRTIAPWIGLTYKMMDQHFAEIFLKENIQVSKQQWIILKILHEEHDGLIQNDLAFITNRNKASLTRLISVMEKNQLVIRKHSKKDARINLIFITETGRKLFTKMKPIMLSGIETLQDGLSNKEILDFINTLSKIQQNIKNQSI